MGNALADQTQMGLVSLDVADLDGMTKYYCDAVLLDVASSDGAEVALGRYDIPANILWHSPPLRYAGPNQTGLFHTTIPLQTCLAGQASKRTNARREPAPWSRVS